MSGLLDGTTTTTIAGFFPLFGPLPDTTAATRPVDLVLWLSGRQLHTHRGPEAGVAPALTTFAKHDATITTRPRQRQRLTGPSPMEIRRLLEDGPSQEACS